MSDKKFRLVTRSDFDGLVCAVLLKEMDLIDEVVFVHPKDMQDGKFAVTARDITTNLPYVPGVHLCFDHHDSEATRNEKPDERHIIEVGAASAARVVYNHYGGKEAFPRVSEALMTAVDKADSADYGPQEIIHPSNWTLLNYIMDSRTGLGRFKDFRISNYQLMMDLIDHCTEHSVDEILALPDVKERIDLYREHDTKARAQILRCSQLHGNLVVYDTREEDTLWAVNRFMIYALFPQANISLHALWGPQKAKTVFAVGKSIVDRSSQTHVGNLMLKYGGGGHQAAGTCQVENHHAEQVLQELIAQINQDG